ncbi:hypothetical protein [Metabacillus malikii]|uniref:Uncharacterized protein n=1 Tax=Metabacillus malikii TaxID=1504265 RepID=A0ABT9Z9C7_9BACI|nr:hypothetical protein [Metabacillus malikii]MDQ0228865.1 hypothetical protein [Metabacillus malikii]
MPRGFENEFDEDKILEIIHQFKKDMKVKGKVKPRQVFEYVAENYDLGKYPFLPKKPSYDYWRKWDYQGKKLIEKVNSINTEPVLKNDETEDSGELIDTEDAVHKLYTGNKKDKQKLINSLRINEVKAKKYFKRMHKLEKQLEEEKEQKNKYKQQADALQTILFQIMEHSASQGFPVDNLINTGKTRTQPVQMILEQIFADNPLDGYQFDQYQNEKAAERNNQNVVKLKNKQSASDQFGYL